ncbi:hypothetical protein MMC12_001632 [Toensbergia leucococca]|nr:hypothetical protein [Toensbergia leucococca]
MLPLFKALVVVFIVLTFLLLQADNIRDAVPSVKNMHMRYTTHPNPVTNSTLGFQQIFALSLPERADRRIPLINAAKATNISFTSLDAVRDKEIPKDEWPKGWNSDNEHKEGELGCLISHKRTWEKHASPSLTAYKHH